MNPKLAKHCKREALCKYHEASLLHPISAIGILVLVYWLFLPVSAWAISDACRENIKRFNEALMPFANTGGKGIGELGNHSAWMQQEMAYAARNGCNPEQNSDENRMLMEFEAGIRDGVNTCKQFTDGSIPNFCQPRKYPGTAPYQRPTLLRPSSDPDNSQVQRRAPQTSFPLSAESTGADSQALALAQQNQSRGDEQARKDGRKRNDSAYEAHTCLSPSDLDNPRSFGSLRNSCSYRVEFHFCVVRPNASAWSTAFDCEKQSFGGGSAGPGGRGPAQIKGAQSVLWFACRSPAIVVDQRYDAAGGGLTGRCRVIGG